MPKLTIDGKEIEVSDDTTIIQAAEQLGIDIPRYCYHPALPVAGNCRICLVEVEKQPKLQIACYTKVANGMVVKTNSPKVLETRKNVLEFLLVNHPLDCPVCDQAGECKLQDYYMEHGQYSSRLKDVKVKKEKKAVSIGPNVMLDQERCILCTRCVRFTDNVTHTHELGVFQRGDHSQLDVAPGQTLDNPYSANVVDICPVGALTDKDFRFKCRVWYLEKTPSVCPGCSMGCNLTVEWDKKRPHQQKPERVMRLKPRHNPDVNNFWLCDRGRYNYRFIDQNRITQPVSKGQSIEWEAALGQISQRLMALRQAKALSKVAVILSAQLTNEDLFLAQELFVKHLGLESVDFRVPQEKGQDDGWLMKADLNPNTAGAVHILKPGQNPQDQGAVNAIMDKASRGEIDILYVLGHDLTKAYGQAKVEEIARKVSLFIFQGSNHHATSALAHLVLPSAVYAEKDGTFTNCQQRVQRILPAFLPLGQSKEDWRIFALLASQLGFNLQAQGSTFIFDRLAQTIDAFKGLSYSKLGEKGMILGANDLCQTSSSN